MVHGIGVSGGGEAAAGHADADAGRARLAMAAACEEDGRGEGGVHGRVGKRTGVRGEGGEDASRNEKCVCVK